MNQTFEHCSLLDTKSWFQKAVPEPTVKNFTTQFGVHLEEVAESLEAVEPMNTFAAQLIMQASVALSALGDYLKANEGCVKVLPEDGEEFLDALCDQIVTATGTAHMLGYDIVAAMTEVNRSNFSKFDEAGQPIFNENRKIMKGPNYFKPVLTPYLPE